MCFFLHITFYNTIQRQDKSILAQDLYCWSRHDSGDPQGWVREKFMKKWDPVSHTYPDTHLELGISYFYERKFSYIIYVTWSGCHYQVLRVVGVHCILRSSEQSRILKSRELVNTRNTFIEVMINRWIFHPFVIFLLKIYF